MTEPSFVPQALANLRPRTLSLFAILGIQTVCALFFLIDVIYDLLGIGDFLGTVIHAYVELAVVVGLVFGIVFISLEIQNVMRRQRRMEDQLRVASGAFLELLEQYFDEWALTPSERDVALFTVKGLSISEIADVRDTKEGTVKAQCNAIYRKAGVNGRPQLLSLFIEQLMDEGLIAQRAA